LVDSIRDSIRIRIVMPDLILHSIRMQAADSQVTIEKCNVSVDCCDFVK